MADDLSQTGTPKLNTDFICDLCSAANPQWVYPASSFQFIEGILGSQGNWMACDACHDLIEAGNRDGLLTRSVMSMLAAHPELRDDSQFIWDATRQLHSTFFRHRIVPNRLEVS